MRDLLAVAWQMQRTPEGTAPAPAGPPPRRPGRLRTLALTGLVFVLGLGLGAAPFFANWNGAETRKLTHEQVLGLVTQHQDPDHVGTLLVFLAGNAVTGMEAISRLRDLGNDFSQHASSAIRRINYVLANGRADRTSARRYPPWIPFDTALASLRTVEQPSENAWDCLEVVVYVIEESVLQFYAKQEASGLLGQRRPEGARCVAATPQLRLSLVGRP